MDKQQLKKIVIDILVVIGSVKILSIILAYFSANTQAALQAASPHPVFKTADTRAIEEAGRAAASSDAVPVAGAASVADETAFQGIDLAGFLL